MDETNLRNLSPLDGRYRDKTKESREIFSEESLINKRLTVELKWLKFFIKNFRKDLIKKSDFKKLDSLLKKLPKNLPLKVKEIEKTEVEGNLIIVETTVNEYEEIDGVLIPSEINQVTPALPIPGGITIKFSKIKLDVKTSDSDFN